MARLVAAVAVASVAALVSFAWLPSSTGCAGDDCDSDTATWGSCTQGGRVDANTWESGPVLGAPYLDFHGQRTWTLDPSPLMGPRVPVSYEAYLSLDPLPAADGGGGFVQSAGNLAEMTPVLIGGVWKVTVKNDTCAQYYLRVVLRYADDGGTPPKTTCQADGGH